MTLEEAEQAVIMGEGTLDAAIPGWWREDAEQPIDLGTLHMSSPCLCVLGQSHPGPGHGFVDHSMKLSGIRVNNPQLSSWAMMRGFDARSLDDYDILRDVWIRRITARRQAARQ